MLQASNGPCRTSTGVVSGGMGFRRKGDIALAATDLMERSFVVVPSTDVLDRPDVP